MCLHVSHFHFWKVVGAAGQSMPMPKGTGKVPGKKSMWYKSDALFSNKNMLFKPFCQQQQQWLKVQSCTVNWNCPFLTWFQQTSLQSGQMSALSPFRRESAVQESAMPPAVFPLTCAEWKVVPQRVSSSLSSCFLAVCSGAETEQRPKHELILLGFLLYLLNKTFLDNLDGIFYEYVFLSA